MNVCIYTCRLSSFDATCTFVMTLQLLSTLESGVPFLGIYMFMHQTDSVYSSSHGRASL